VRYGAAAGGAEEAHSRQRHLCPWSKPVNVETWGHVSGPIVMAHAFAELRYGIVAHQHERDFNYGHNFAHTLYGLGMLHVRYRARRNHGTLFEPLAARQRTPGIATDVLVMRIGAVGHRAGRGGRHGSRRGSSHARSCRHGLVEPGIFYLATRECSLKTASTKWSKHGHTSTVR